MLRCGSNFQKKSYPASTIKLDAIASRGDLRVDLERVVSSGLRVSGTKYPMVVFWEFSTAEILERKTQYASSRKVLQRLLQTLCHRIFLLSLEGNIALRNKSKELIFVFQFWRCHSLHTKETPPDFVAQTLIGGTEGLIQDKV